MLPYPVSPQQALAAAELVLAAAVAAMVFGLLILPCLCFASQLVHQGAGREQESPGHGPEGADSEWERSRLWGSRGVWSMSPRSLSSPVLGVSWE